MNNRKHDQGQEILDTEDDDGEGVLHPLGGPHLHTHREAGPGEADRVDGLEDKNRGGDEESQRPDEDVDHGHGGVGQLGGEAVGHLGDGEPPVNGDGRDGPRGHEDVGALDGGDQFAGQQAQIPLAPVETLDQGGRDADNRGGNARNCKIENKNVLWGPVHFLA